MDTSLPYSSEVPHGFQQFFHSNYQRILKFFRNRVATEADAEDLTQDVFLSVARSFDSPGIKPSLAWLLTIANNALKNHYRKQSAKKRDAPPVTPFEENLHAKPQQHDDHPESSLEVKNDLKKLEQAVAILPEPKRSCFAMHFFEGYTAREIAELLKLKHETVKSHILRARNQVIEYFKG